MKNHESEAAKKRAMASLGSTEEERKIAELSAEHVRDPATGEPLFTHRGFAALVERKVAPEEAREVTRLSNEVSNLAYALDEAIALYQQKIKPWRTDREAALADLRGFRLAVVTEVSQATRPLEDLRSFFMGKNHDEEIRRLKEFVDLCERLKGLKDSGFLDTVAETMLRLEAGGGSKP